MKSFKKLHKFICCALSLFILTYSLSGCTISITGEGSSSSQSQASKQESLAPESLSSDIAFKYKDSVMSLQEYIAILIELSSDESFQRDMDKSKAKAIEEGKLILLVREKLKQSGKDLPQERKKSARDSMYQNLYNGYSDGRSLSQAEKEEVLKIFKNVLEAAGSSVEACEEFAEDDERQKFGILEEHIEVKETEYDDVIVNYEAIDKVDVSTILEAILVDSN